MRITLRKVKSVARLEFEVPNPGLWILTGWNGSGKSTLLAALYRLGSSGAFQTYFKAGSLTSSVDRYEDSEVEYEINGEIVVYRYGGQRWRASPRKNSEIILDSGFEEVIYLEANAARIEPHQREIRSNRIYACDADLCDFMEHVLGDEKWRDLKYVYTSRGGGGKLRAYLIQYKVGSRNRYFSERSFSLGELCVLRLAVKVLKARNGSLLLIDEVEMALHPEAQMRLMERIRKIAADESLTVIFSTHSATIIKHSDRANLIYLNSVGGGLVEVVYGAFPARVLGDISSAGELSVDFLFYVEDEQARFLLEALMEKYYAGGAVVTQPRVRVVPVGGYYEVIKMLANTGGLIPAYVMRAAFLDHDAQASVAQRVAAHEEPFSATLRGVQNHVRYLPATPEVGLVQLLEDAARTNGDARRFLLQQFPAAAISPHSIVSRAGYVAVVAANPRAEAKKKAAFVVDELSSVTGISPTDISRRLYAAFVSWTYRAGLGPLSALLGPELNRRR